MMTDPAAGAILIASDLTLDRFGLTLKTQPGVQGVDVTYTGIPGNQPLGYANSVALWDTWNPILAGPHKIDPLCVVPIPSNLQPSSVHIPYDTFTGTEYLVSYQVGEPLTTMAAGLPITVRLAPDTVQPTSVSLSVQALTTDAITIEYGTLTGYRPETFGNWIAFWQGFPGPYYASPPVQWAPISGDSTQGLISLSGLDIIAGFTYCIIYFMGPTGGDPATNLGAMLTFTAAQAKEDNEPT
jgi:hypothetical protein